VIITPTARKPRFYTRYNSVMQRWPDSMAKGAEFALAVA
jgi:malonate-semialdehyde dehydrogenase (acetylating)/methylmalonate-semialdehyde dehydrogenase